MSDRIELEWVADRRLGVGGGVVLARWEGGLSTVLPGVEGDLEDPVRVGYLLEQAWSVRREWEREAAARPDLTGKVVTLPSSGVGVVRGMVSPWSWVVELDRGDAVEVIDRVLRDLPPTVRRSSFGYRPDDVS